ncbi:hypothetical protein ACODYM_28745 [Burkholderia gladioli]|uniref:hypothetical protein n=1 Tax=Burkholderia gladioli TaxID=28095 RepID=UPI003B50222C
MKIVGLDPSLRNTGIAIATFDPILMDYTVDQLELAATEKESGKKVRQNSDDLRCARIISMKIREACNDAVFAISEVPTGAQSSRAAFSFGIVLGVLANLAVPLIQVSPSEVKMATVGHKTASKLEMINWAVGRHPNVNWLRHQRNGKDYQKGDLMNDNEHLADACAVIAAGVRSDEFQQAVAMFSYASRRAA